MTDHSQTTTPAHLSYSGKTVLVTGAGSGIGLATVEAFARAGATVVACDYRRDALEVIEHTLEPHGLHAHFIEADIRQDDDVAAMMATITGALGLSQLDIAINNAGIEGPQGPLDRVDLHGPGGVTDTINTNLVGTIRCVREQLKLMRPQGHGTIINIASVFGTRGAPNAGTYSATKHGIIGLTRTVAYMEGRHGIRTLTISPGGVDTPLLRRTFGESFDVRAKRTPLKRFATPADIADAILAAAQPSPLFVNGVDIKVDGATFPH